MRGTVLVTGAAGFIGSHLCELLLERGELVVGLDNFDPYYDPKIKRYNIVGLLQRPGFTFYEADIRDSRALASTVHTERVDRIVHLAALAGVRASVDRAADYVDVNVRGSCNVFEAARRLKVDHVVVASTSSVYGSSLTVPFTETDLADRPLAPYPATKRAAEVLAHAYHNMHGLNVTAVRFFSVYGPRGRPDMMPYQLSNSLIFGQEVVLFEGGQMRRDWTYVSDIVAGVVGALDHPRGYEIYNLGRGEPVLMVDFLRYLEGLSGCRVNARVLPAPASEAPSTFADISKARSHFGYEPRVPVQEGMAEFWEWRIAQRDAQANR